MPRVNHFGIPADDPQRALKFYHQVFGWEFQLGWEYDTPGGREQYWNVVTGSGDESGINGGLTRREFPGQPIGVGIQVPSVDEYTSRVEKHGGKVIVGRQQLPKVGWFALCQDSEGNTFVIFQSASSVE